MLPWLKGYSGEKCSHSSQSILFFYSRSAKNLMSRGFPDKKMLKVAEFLHKSEICKNFDEKTPLYGSFNTGDSSISCFGVSVVPPCIQ